MINKEKIDSLVEDVAGVLSGGANVGEEVRKNLRALLSSALARMDLVTREEFDAQTKVLARTRAKLEKLEQELATLERQGTS